MTRIAVGQFASGPDTQANIERITTLAEQAARDGADVIVLPEGAMRTFGEKGEDLSPCAEPLDGRFVDALSRLSTRLGATIVAGMFELIPGERKVHNTAVVVAPQRGLVVAHRKRHVYDAFEDRESDQIRPGEGDLPIVDIDGFRAAIAICYELRFPAYIQQAADSGAELLLVPSAWVAGPLKEDHWTVMVRARAIENTMYVAGAGMNGPGYCGKSMIVDPMGVVAASLGEADGVASADVTRERLARVRARLPLVEQRRARVRSL
jgi:predicted amidohydrolase